MDKDKIRIEVKEIVEGFLSDKEESKIKARMEEALIEAKETISSLTQTVSEKDTAIAEFEGEMETRNSSITSLEGKVKELETAIESLTVEKENAVEQATTFETKLAEIKKEQLANLRLAKIIEAKLIRETEDVKEKTKAKVKEMSDEEFDTYVEDLSEVRNSFLEELKKQKDAEDAKEDPDKDEGSEEDTCECAKEDCVKCNPVKEDAELAALNIETDPSEDLIDKYKNAFKEAGFINKE